MGEVTRKKIAIVEHSSCVGGTAKCVYQFAVHLDKKLFDVRVYARAKVGWYDRLERDFPDLAVSYTNRPLERQREEKRGVASYLRKIGSILETLLCVRRYYREFRDVGIDIVHTNNNLYASLPAIIAAKVSSIPVICHLHDQSPLTLTERLAIPFVDKFIVLSESARAEFSKFIPANKIVKVPNGISSQEILGEAEVKTIAVEVKRPAIGVVGRLVPWKGQETLIKAVSLVCKEIPDCMFYVIGDDPSGNDSYRKYLVNLSEELGCKERIVFTGWIDNPAPIVRQLDVLVCPSIKPEPFGLVILEAMVLGVPVIATEQGGPLDIISHGKDGFFFPPGESKVLAMHIIRLLREVGLKELISASGCEKVLREFTVETSIRKIEREYNNLLGSS